MKVSANLPAEVETDIVVDSDGVHIFQDSGDLDDDGCPIRDLVSFYSINRAKDFLVAMADAIKEYEKTNS